MASGELLGGPITQSLDAGVLPMLDGLIGKLKSLGEAGTHAAALLAHAGQGAGALFGQLSGGVDTVVSLATHIAALSDEQHRLTDIQTATGLSFEAAAAGAGRYVEATDVLAARQALFASGVSVTQAQLEAMTHTAASTATTLHTTTAQELTNLTHGLITGREEGLRPFGAHLAELGGHAHTTAQRLAAVVAHAHDLPPAADDASTSIQRLHGSFAEMQRTAAGAFVDEFTALGTARGISATLRTQTDDSQDAMRGLGRMAADVFHNVLHVAGTVGAAVATAMTAVYDTLGNVGTALMRLVHGDFAGAAHAMTEYSATTQAAAVVASQASQITDTDAPNASPTGAELGHQRTGMHLGAGNRVVHDVQPPGAGAAPPGAAGANRARHAAAAAIEDRVKAAIEAGEISDITATPDGAALNHADAVALVHALGAGPGGAKLRELNRSLSAERERELEVANHAQAEIEAITHAREAEDRAHLEAQAADTPEAARERETTHAEAAHRGDAARKGAAYAAQDADPAAVASRNAAAAHTAAAAQHAYATSVLGVAHAARAEADALQAATDAADAHGASFGVMAQEAVAGAEGIAKAGLAAGLAHKNVGEAIKESLTQFLSTKAVEWGLRSLEYTAMALGLSATTLGIPNPGSIGAAGAALLYGAAAVAAGGASLALGATSGGGASSSSQAPAPAPAPPAINAPGGSDRGGNTTVIDFSGATIVGGLFATPGETGHALQTLSNQAGREGLVTIHPSLLPAYP